MKDFDNPITETERKTLREGIKNRYRQYHLLDRDRFPDFEYNTNRANYEPLRASFENEFFVIRSLDRINPAIHIPSTNTLVSIFTDDSYVPIKKILITCHLYAEGRENADLDTNGVITTPKEIPKAIRNNRRLILAEITTIVVSLLFFAYLIHSSSFPANGLIIYQPYHKQIVPRIIYVEGKVTNADVVWIVVRPMKQADKCYVQSLANVEKDGTWKGSAIIGTLDEGTVDMAFQIRAFVNPNMVLREGDILRSWPEAELSSNAIEVVRGPKEIEE